jgi:hypothetical protein
MLLAYSLFRSHQDYSPLVIFGIASVLWLVGFPRYWNWSIRRRTRKLLTEGPTGFPYIQTLEIAEDGIHGSSPKGTSILNWSALTKVAESDTDLYLFVGPMNAIVIPRKAVQSADEYERFAAELRWKREHAAGLTFMT